MTDYTELIRTLRELAEDDNDEAAQAADAIEELQQAVEHYKGCADDWYKEACDYKAMMPRLKNRISKHSQHTMFSDSDVVVSGTRLGPAAFCSKRYYDHYVEIINRLAELEDMICETPPKED